MLMDAIIKPSREKGLDLIRKEIPKIEFGEALVKIHYTAICGTDVHIYDWNEWAQNTIKPPMTIGHEFVGEIVEIKSATDSFKAGDIVSGEGHVVCGKCRNCRAGRKHLCPNTSGIGVNRDGIFAEYAKIPVSNLWLCDTKNIPEKMYAIFDPLGNATHTALKFGMVGEDVLITGAGPIGIMAAAICRHVGAKNVVITDISDYRLELAKRVCPSITTVNTKNVKLKEADANGAKHKVIVTDGVFSMDGIIANLKGVCDLAEKYNALVVVDDSHATGFVGKTGRGTAKYCGVQGRVDIITGTFGKALGGASGGFTSGRKEIIDLLRQRSRPYLFSNTVAPAICATTLKVLEMLTKDNSLCNKVMENAKYFRSEMEKNGFDLAGKDHAIVPVMLYDAVLSQKVAEKMLEKGIYVTGFFYPVVPKDKARIRTQMSAGHSKEDIDKCVQAFVECKKELGF